MSNQLTETLRALLRLVRGGPEVPSDEEINELARKIQEGPRDQGIEAARLASVYTGEPSDKEINDLGQRLSLERGEE